MSDKPKVLFISDVKGWAWWIKSKYIKKYLSDEFDIDIIYVIGEGKTVGLPKKKYDIYFTYGWSFIDLLSNIPKKKRVTGVTAHRAREVIVPRMEMAGWIHANSILLYEELKSWGLENVYYLPNGVDEKLFTPYPVNQEKELVIGHIGKLSPKKGQEEYIIPAVNISGAKSFYHFNKWKNAIKHKKMPELYKNFDVYICASFEDGTPNPGLESAACGRPIISNRIGNMPEFVKNQHNGFLVDRNVDKYVEKIRYFMENRDEVKRMGDNARKTVEEEWTWKIQSERYRKMFKDMIK